MEGTVTGRGIKIKWTADNPKQASSGASECFQRNVMTKHRRKDHPMRKMIGKSRGRAEKSGGGRGRKDNVGIGGRRLWQAYHLLLTEILTVLRQPDNRSASSEKPRGDNRSAQTMRRVRQ